MSGFRRACVASLVLLCLSFCRAGAASAETLSFDVTVDRKTVAVGSSLKLNLTFRGSQSVPAPDLPEIDGFQIRYMGPSSEFSIVNGRTASSITHVYSLLAVREGTYKIPGFSLDYKGATMTSDPITIRVAASPSGRRGVDGGAGAEEDLKDRVFLTMETVKKDVFISEIILLKIKLYVGNIGVRDIQYPEFERRGFQAERFDEPRRYRETLNGISYEVFEFTTDVFATRPGKWTLGPASLELNILVKRDSRSSTFDRDFFDRSFFDDFFDRYEKYPLRLESPGISVDVSNIPSEGRPPGFDGAVGNYRLYAEASPTDVKTGDPITLKITVAGEGNFKTVKMPDLDIEEDDFKVYEPNVKAGKGAKEFEQVLIPKNADVKKIPKLRFVYFDPSSGRFRTAEKGPIPIKVKPLGAGEKVSLFELPESTRRFGPKEVLGRDLIYIKESPGRLRPVGPGLPASPLFAFLLLAPVPVVAGAYLYSRKRERIMTDTGYARRIRAPVKARKNLARTGRFLSLGDEENFYGWVYRTLREYLGDRFQLPAAGITSEVVTLLADRGAEAETLEKLKTCFDYCDRARYAPAGVAKADMKKTFRLLEELIEELERKKA